MPRYEFTSPPQPGARRDAAVHLAARRFPELTLEHRGSAGGDATDRDHWVCRAPGLAHLLRWADAAGVAIEGLRPPATDGSAGDPPAPTPSAQEAPA